MLLGVDWCKSYEIRRILASYRENNYTLYVCFFYDRRLA